MSSSLNSRRMTTPTETHAVEQGEADRSKTAAAGKARLVSYRLHPSTGRRMLGQIRWEHQMQLRDPRVQKTIQVMMLAVFGIWLGELDARATFSTRHWVM